MTTTFVIVLNNTLVCLIYDLPLNDVSQNHMFYILPHSLLPLQLEIQKHDLLETHEQPLILKKRIFCKPIKLSQQISSFRGEGLNSPPPFDLSLYRVLQTVAFVTWKRYVSKMLKCYFDEFCYYNRAFRSIFLFVSMT